MINNIEKTFPIKMGEITSISGLPFKSRVKSFDSRLKRTFMKVFRMENMDNKYWKTLKNMTLNPDEVFGLVAVDGYVHDVWGKDDIALVFNMGIPRLRGRRIHYLDRIYARIEKNRNVKLYNSIYNDKGSNHFEFCAETPAWHPHISGSEPCLGGYDRDLSKWKSEGNPIMYLKTLHSFLNTWNSRSPFWNLNRCVIIDKVTNGLKGSENITKEFLSSVIQSVTYKKSIDKFDEFKNFIKNNLCKINTGSVPNDIYCLAEIFKRIDHIKPHLSEKIKKEFDNKQYLYFQAHTTEVNKRKDNRRKYSQSEFSILPWVSANTMFVVPNASEDGTMTYFTTREIMSGVDQRLSEIEGHDVNKSILLALSTVLSDFYYWINSNEMIKSLLNDADYAIDIYCTYLAPLQTRKQLFYDKMTNTGSYKHRVTETSIDIEDAMQNTPNSEEYKKKYYLNHLYNSRCKRIKRMLIAFYGKSLNKEFIYKCIENKISSYFKYSIDNEEDQDNYLIGTGLFWRRMSYYRANNEFYNTLSIINKFGKINSVESLINAYEVIKRQSVTAETETLINEYDKIIRSLKKYGHKTEHTNEDTQQVHLSFK